METLLITNSCKNRWYPISIQSIKTYLKLDFSVEGSEPLQSNLAYNLQYIQYIEKQLSDLNLSSVLYTMLYKSYIISGMGIVEGLFTNLLKSKNAWRKTNWESNGKMISNEMKMNDKIVRIEMNYSKRLTNIMFVWIWIQC